MQLSITTAFIVFLGVAYAAPADLAVRGTPSNAPVTFDHLPDESKSFKCDILLAAQRSVALQEIHETRGKYQYPHSFPHNESKGHKLQFPAYCPEGKDRMEFPLVLNGPYDGGRHNLKQGDERVVYFYEGEIDNDGHTKATYCGIMTHVGAPTGGFRMCH